MGDAICCPQPLKGLLISETRQKNIAFLIAINFMRFEHGKSSFTGYTGNLGDRLPVFK
jgi:hypothetical protein